MPKIASYGGQRVATEVVAGPKATAQRLDYGLNTALAAGQQVAAAYDKSVKEDSDRADTAEAEQALHEYQTGYGVNLNSPDGGYFNTSNREAYDTQSVTIDNIRTLRDKIADNIKSVKAREMFSRTADVHDIRNTRDIMKHASKGLKQWEIGNSKSAAEMSIANAPLNYNRPDELGVEHNSGLLAVNQLLELQGVPEGEDAVQARSTFTSSFYSGAILRGLADGSGDGQKLFDKYKDKLSGEDTIKLISKIKTVRDADGAILKTEELMRKFATDPEDIGYNGARASIDKIKDPVERNRVRTMWSSSVSRRVRQHNADVAESVDMFANAIASGLDINKVIAKNPGEWGKIKDENTKRKILSGVMITTDPSASLEVSGMSREQFLAFDFNDPRYLGKFSKGDKKGYIASQISMREGKGRTFVHTRSSAINSHVKKLFADKKGKIDYKDKRVSSFMNELQSAIDEETVKLKYNMPPDELNSFVEEKVLDLIVENPWFDDKFSVKDISIDELDTLKLFSSHNPNVSGNKITDARDGLIEDGVEITYKSLLDRIQGDE